MSRIGLLSLLSVFLATAMPVTTQAQYVFLDTNRDGKSTSADKLSADNTDVDIWIQTDKNRDGTTANLVADTTPPSIFSYSVALKVSGGSVSWGAYKNLQPTMIYPFGRTESPTEFYVSYAGTTPLIPGKYRLGTIAITKVSGTPIVDFSPATSMPGGVTSFGSMNQGRDSDNTIKLGETPGGGARAAATVGDFSDSDGLGAKGSNRAGTLADDAAPLRFGARLVRPSGSGIRLIVTTSAPGRLKVRLFDVAGRLVRTLANEGSVPSGVHAFDVQSASSPTQRLARGVYFYRIEGAGGKIEGKVAILD
jgi:hypothetical protein